MMGMVAVDTVIYTSRVFSKTSWRAMFARIVKFSIAGPQ